MNAHTKGPWLYKRRGKAGLVDVFIGDGMNGNIELIAEVINDTNARRITACVNACEGIQTEILEHFGQMAVDGALTNRQLSMQHDKLLEVVRMLVDWNKRYPPEGIYSENAIRRIAAEMKAINTEAISALAKIEPKQQQKETQHA